MSHNSTDTTNTVLDTTVPTGAEGDLIEQILAPKTDTEARAERAEFGMAFAQMIADCALLSRWEETFGVAFKENELVTDAHHARFVNEHARRERIQPFFVRAQEGIVIKARAYGRDILGEVTTVNRVRGRYGYTEVVVSNPFTGDSDVLSWKVPSLESIEIAKLSELRDLIAAQERAAMALVSNNGVDANAVRREATTELKELANLRKKGARRNDEDEARLAALATKYDTTA